MQGSYEFALQIYKNLKSGPKQTKTYYTNKATPLFHEFSLTYRRCFKEIGEKIFSKKKDVKNKIAVFTAIKHIERNADHAFNILENFVYIQEPDFYFRKEARK